MLSTFQVWQAFRTDQESEYPEANRTRLVYQTEAGHWTVDFNTTDPFEPDSFDEGWFDVSCFAEEVCFATREEALTAMFDYDVGLNCVSVLIWEGL